MKVNCAFYLGLKVPEAGGRGPECTYAEVHHGFSCQVTCCCLKRTVNPASQQDVSAHCQRSPWMGQQPGQANRVTWSDSIGFGRETPEMTTYKPIKATWVSITPEGHPRVIASRAAALTQQFAQKEAWPRNYHTFHKPDISLQNFPFFFYWCYVTF